MRFCILFPLFSLLSFTPTTLASPTTDCLSEYCPNNLDQRDPRVPTPTPTPTPTSRLTNAERLARGLPINPPTWRSRHRGSGGMTPTSELIQPTYTMHKFPLDMQRLPLTLRPRNGALLKSPILTRRPRSGISLKIASVVLKPVINLLKTMHW